MERSDNPNGVPLTIDSPDSFQMHYDESIKYTVSPARQHSDEFEIIYVSNGKIEVTISGIIYIAGPGSIVLINKLEPHQINILEYPYSRYVLMFRREFLSILTYEPLLASLLNYHPKNFQHLIKMDPVNIPEVNCVFSKIREEYTSKKPHWEAAIKMLIGQLAVYLYRNLEGSTSVSSENHSIKKDIIIEIMSYINQHYMEEITLKDISIKFHSNIYYLCHLFKEYTGDTFRTHLIKRRISSAKDLLINTNKGVAMIANETGFNSGNNFIQTFKKTVGDTPYQFKKKSQL